MQLYRSVCRICYDNAFSTYHIILSFTVNMDNVVCMKPFKDTITGLMWLAMCINVSNCHSCAKTGTAFKHKRHLQPFPVTRPWELDAMDILGPLPQTKKVNQHVVIITNIYSNLTLAIPNAIITKTPVAFIFFDAWVILYGIALYLLSASGTQLVRKRFGTLCTHLGTKHIIIGQVKRYNKIVARLRYYDDPHQCNSDFSCNS